MAGALSPATGHMGPRQAFSAQPGAQGLPSAVSREREEASV